MKKFIILFAIALIYNSCSTSFIPCVSNIHPDNIETKMFPLKTGNVWEYKISGFDEKGKIEYTGRDIREIGRIDTLYYLDDGLNKVNALVYRLIRNGVEEKKFFYLKCEDGAVFARSFEYSPREIAYGRTIPEIPFIGYKDPRYSDIRSWNGPEMIEVPAGKFECWVCEYTDPFVPKKFIREYYSSGVGLVKMETLNWVNRVIESRDLTSYTLK